MKLLGEEIDSEVAVLTGLGRGRDADDLARTSLKDQQVADADKVTGDGDGVRLVGTPAGFDKANVLSDTLTNPGRALLVDDDLFAVMMMSSAERVHDPVGSTLDAATERVVMTFVVVVAHVAFVARFFVNNGLSV